MLAIREAAEAADRAHGITLRGIITCIRHFGPDRARPIARCAADTAGDWLVGFGMAGDELIGQPGDYTWAFDCAREAGLRITVHAGEWGGAASVRAALDQLSPERLGHGVQAIEDLALVDRLAEDGIVLECCPGSNVVLGVFKDWPSHPIERLRERGVKVTVSTDDPPFFGITMASDYENLNRHFGWDAAIFAEINRTALDAAFCDPATKQIIAKRLGETQA